MSLESLLESVIGTYESNLTGEYVEYTDYSGYQRGQFISTSNFSQIDWSWIMSAVLFIVCVHSIFKGVFGLCKR